MEYHDGRKCISMRDLVGAGIMSESNYKALAARGRIEVARRGGGSKSHYALIVVESLPTRFQERVNEAFPDGGRKEHLAGWVSSNYETDQAAATFFFSKEKCGVELPPEKAREYVVNASVLNCCIRLYERASQASRNNGEKYDWGEMAAAIESLREQYGHTLPTSVLRFRRKVNDYRNMGYGCLISGKFGNQCARRMSHKEERICLSLACLPNKPWNKNVRDMYEMFVCGELDVYDLETGELFNPDDVTMVNGEPWVPSEATITNYLNKPKNQAVINRATKSFTAFMHEDMPHMHRHHPEYSLSKVSFDDRDLPRKLKDTRLRPKAYYAYDVASGCCIGYAYNRSKNVDLVVDMFRNMFRLLGRHGWGCPAEVEVENHLMSQWRDSFLRAGVMFPFVRFCAPMNSQEKHAEHSNGSKKRSIEHKNHIGIGRFFAKRRQYRTESVKVFDEFNNTYVDKEYYTWDELIADDMKDIMEYNNAPHPNQKKYRGMSRWDVLVANINPDLRPLDAAALAKFVGERVSTSVRRNSYCRVCGEDWWISKPEVLELLAPNDYKVEARYLTDEQGEITDMFIFQNDMLIDRLDRVGTYNTARAEQTDTDRAIFQEQQHRLGQFKQYMERNAVPKVGISPRVSAPAEEEEDLTVAAAPIATEGAKTREEAYVAEDTESRAYADI